MNIPYYGCITRWISVIALSLAIVFSVFIIKMNARLDALEAASTCAQQPQERHFILDTVKLYVDKKGDVCISKRHPVSGDSMHPLYYVK
jgi:hypothetical protein